MKKLLFLVNNGRISPNENGGASVYYSHLELLHTIGYEVDLLVVLWEDDKIFDLRDYSEIKSYVKSIEYFKPLREPGAKSIKRAIEAVTAPERFEYNFLNSTNFEEFKLIVSRKNYDLIWAEWRWNAFLAAYAKLNSKIVYAHHDWEFRLSKLRNKATTVGRFHSFQKKRAEIDLVKKATACISGSATETEEIIEISKRPALYMPTTYHSIKNKSTPNESSNIIHLGGMGTTANRKGLERFIDVCWKKIKAHNSEVKLIVIGSLKQSGASLLDKLQNDPQIDCKGFVDDLESVLLPEDIHIIPWEYNTGTRTRLPVIFNHMQSLVAISESVASCPEVQNDYNAVLCDTLETMSAEIIALLDDSEKRKKLSKNGKFTFEENYTVKNNCSKLEKFIESI